MKVLVDADSCPVLDVVRQVCDRAGVPVITVASFNHNIVGPGHVMVGPEPQAADMAIINRTRRGDLVVTQDYGLAALVLGKGAHALSPWGHRFTEAEMDSRLAQRALYARWRRGGHRIHASRQSKTEKRVPFVVALREALFECLRNQAGTGVNQTACR